MSGDRPRPGRSELVLVAGLLLLQALLSATAAERWSLTYDEHLYLPAGWTYWTQGDFRISREHPPLTKLVAAAPLLPMDLEFDRARTRFEAAPEHEATWAQYEMGVAFLVEDNLERFDEIVRRGRRAMLLFALFFSACAWAFARELWGPSGGLLALALSATNPDVLSHGALVTNDLPMAAFLLASVALFRSHALRPAAWKPIALGLAVGAGFATKYSSLLVLPVLGLLVLAAWRDPRCREAPAGPLRPFGAGHWRERTMWIAASVASVLALAMLVVWACYLFREPPWAWARGAFNVYALAVEGYEGFLLGEYREGPFPHYYLVALALKLPLGTLGLGLLVAGLAWRERRRWRLLDAGALLAAPALVLVAMTALTLQIGHRYVFGVHAFLFVACGALGPPLARWLRGGRSRLGAGAAALLLAAVVSSLSAWPWLIGYSNALVPSRLAFFGLLDAANNDWQQGWKELARLQELGELGPVFHYRPPLERERFAPYGIRHVPLELDLEEPAPGTHAFSALRHARSLKANRALGRHVPLLEEHPPTRVVGGSVVLLEVPERPPAEAPGGTRTDEQPAPRHGPYERRGPDGTLREEGSYRHGELHGIYRLYREDGSVLEEGRTWRGRLHGRIVRFDEVGRPAATWHYLDGRRVLER